MTSLLHFVTFSLLLKWTLSVVELQSVERKPQQGESQSERKEEGLTDVTMK